MTVFFSNLFNNIKRHKGLFFILIISTIFVCVLGVYSALNFDSIAITIDLGNVTFIKFLKGDVSFVSLLFGSALMLAVFYLVIICCGCKKFLIPFALLFYLYFVYSQIVILTSVILIYGFLNTLILLFFLFAYVVLEFLIFMLLVLEIFNHCGASNYFSVCFKNCAIFAVLLVGLVFLFALILAILKSFVILLVF